jgi:hypothetical protein
VARAILGALALQVLLVVAPLLEIQATLELQVQPEQLALALLLVIPVIQVTRLRILQIPLIQFLLFLML